MVFLFSASCSAGYTISALNYTLMECNILSKEFIKCKEGNVVESSVYTDAYSILIIIIIMKTFF